MPIQFSLSIMTGTSPWNHTMPVMNYLPECHTGRYYHALCTPLIFSDFSLQQLQKKINANLEQLLFNILPTWCWHLDYFIEMQMGKPRFSPKYRMAVYILSFIDPYCQLCKLSGVSGKQLSEITNSGKFQIGNHLQNTGVHSEKRGVRAIF